MSARAKISSAQADRASARLHWRTKESLFNDVAKDSITNRDRNTCVMASGLHVHFSAVSYDTQTKFAACDRSLRQCPP